MPKLAVGIDIGGTNTLIILADSQGKIYRRNLIPTRKPSFTLEQILKVIRGYPVHLKKGIRAVGIACAGMLDARSGRLISSPNLASWRNVPLKGYFRRRLKVPVAVENDANAAALGERYFGAGKGKNNLLFYTVSTGIGGGIIIQGKIYQGKSLNAGELGHTLMLAKGPKCGCGKRGCLEALASGTAIAKIARKRIKTNPGSRLARLKGKIDAHQVAEAARRGDRLAREIFQEACGYLGLNIANMIQSLDPEMVIIGGGVSSEGKIFFAPLKNKVKRHLWPKLYRSCPIVKAKLGSNAGALGMVALVSLRAPGLSTRR